MSNYEQFIRELSVISLRYGIYITGCGCCNSPFLVEHEPELDESCELTWDKDNKEYVVWD